MSELLTSPFCEGTTSGGVRACLAPLKSGVLFLAIACSVTTADAARADDTDVEWRQLLQRERQTSAGGTARRIEAPAAQIAELRRISGLTWDQLARLFDLSRRSLHYWASGKPSTPANEERLQRLLSAVRRIDRGSGAATREALLAAGNDGRIAVDLLAEGAYDEVVQRLGERPAVTRPAIPRISERAREARRPLPPATLLDARHDPIHRDPGEVRGAKSGRPRGQ